MIVSGERRNAGPARTLPAVFGSLAKHNIVGKLADDCRLAACAPPDPLATPKRPEILLLIFLNRPCMFRRINNCPFCSR